MQTPMNAPRTAGCCFRLNRSSGCAEAGEEHGIDAIEWPLGKL